VQSDAQAAKAEATQTALKEMCLRYEDQRAARREAERVRLVSIHPHAEVNSLCRKTQPWCSSWKPRLRHGVRYSKSLGCNSTHRQQRPRQQPQ
jgi:uncharacterized membrane protein YccC